MDFEVLRNMEQFTQDMFNNIIDFQEKKHPAWNPELRFEERIKNLPLHYLVFSNADRDPETTGPTVAHYYPLKQEILTIANYSKQIANNPVVIDVHARNGFIGSLLAQHDLTVSGLRDTKEKPNQIELFYDPEHYHFIDTELSEIQNIDVLFASWTPNTVDLTQQIKSLKPKLVVFIFTNHLIENSDQRQTGVENGFGEKLSDEYYLVDEWQITRRKDLFHAIWPDLTPNIEETRYVRIFAHDQIKNLETPKIDLNDQYAWENELFIAETAHQAKQMVSTGGFPEKV